jgi:hypothetical protein
MAKEKNQLVRINGHMMRGSGVGTKEEAVAFKNRNPTRRAYRKVERGVYQFFERA